MNRAESRADGGNITLGQGGTRAPHESRETGTRDRSPLTWLVAAGAALLIVVAGAMAVTQRDHGPAAVTGRSVARLEYTSTPGTCPFPTVGVLRQQTVAFRGILRSMAGGVASFDVTRWYAGGPAQAVRVTARPGLLRELAQDSNLVTGRSYLVSATGGEVTACGFTGPANARRTRLYDRAFR